MKILSILTIIFSFSQCGSTNFETNPPFKIDSAKYYSWVGGVPGVSGINVQIQLKNTSPIEFDSLYFRKKSTKVEIKDASLLIAHFNTSKRNKPDLILHSDPKKELKNKIPEPDNFPFELKDNEAVLSYHLGGETRYVKIKNIKKQDRSSFPKIQ
ncbi:hypothetical protein [Polaribacter sp. Hel1_85]|uniref:hypothetical protein n=1 Tax=Polaribacter sp. Hel1_85 TaxID=1250005 RepID=UPI00052BEF50|nr:hypothetical protein [Polaribacter sp. Hel1_85]KGL62556.1 hypothetical protein PHEL85_2350 [Polaribacter sp. Hel1_85]